MIKFRIILMTLIIMTNLIADYGWPLKEFDTQHEIVGTFGEYRDGHFHSAIDIDAPESTMVWSVESDTCYILGKGVNIGHFRYYHLAGFRILDSAVVDSGDSIAKTDEDDHIHMMECQTELDVYGDPTNVWWLEPLRDGALTPYVDSVNPHVDSILFYRQGSGDTLLHMDSLDQKVDILSVAGDDRTDSTGQSAGGNCSVYRIGYCIIDTSGNVVKSLWDKIKFDSIFNHEDVARLNLVYGSGSTLSHFRYWVSNDPFNSNPDLRNMYWNTKQDSTGADSIDADSIEAAKFKDGYYWIKVYAFDIANNADSESVYVHVDNFDPKIKETRPHNQFAFVPHHEKRIWCFFSEAMDTGQETRLSGYQRIRESKNYNFQINTIFNTKLCRSFYRIIRTLDKYYIASIIIKEKRRYEGLAEVFASEGLDTFCYL